MAENDKVEVPLDFREGFVDLRDISKVVCTRRRAYRHVDEVLEYRKLVSRGSCPVKKK